MTRLLVTRPDAQQDLLMARLAQAGIGVVSVPTVSLEPPTDADVARLASLLPAADWVVVTSANGVGALVAALSGRPLPTGVRLAAVGPATADALERSGLQVAAVPPRYLTIAIADALGDVAGRRVVLARADAATPDLRGALVSRGATVSEVTAYRTVEGPAASRDLIRLALEDGLDGILFTSGSTVRGLLKLVPSHERQRVTRLPAFCIGPVTAAAANHSGFAVAAVADEYTAGGLARATIQHFQVEES
jgi:uroporphyrinogen III methyltransferase/synthase